MAGLSIVGPVMAVLGSGWQFAIAGGCPLSERSFRGRVYSLAQRYKPGLITFCEHKSGQVLSSKCVGVGRRAAVSSFL
ncbi:hypothetical protein EDD17DRAFT_1159415 [Pisolithus thermaeus]|nr:hypothetical protein EDD17DRAFT_1159415 [Pisolithus thermaeus]